MGQTCVWRSRWLAVGWAVILVGPLALAFTSDNHESITQDALPFLKPAVLKEVVEGNKGVDVSDPTGSHFDNCDFRQGVSQINKWYDELLASDDLFADFPKRAAKIFGWILHFAQDFYAHSNWAETMQALGKGETALFDRRIGQRWEVDCPWANHIEGVIIAQAACPGEREKLPKDWKVELDRKTRLVTVTRADGAKAYGIISGIFEAALRDDCYDTIAMSHGELNKDAVGKDHLAYRLAVNQTRHEWCRLESLVFRKSGQEGLEKLRKAFIDPGKASPCGSYVWLEIKAQTVDGRELEGVKVHVQLGDGYVSVCQTGCKYVVATTVALGVEAPASIQGLAFIEWKLAERRYSWSRPYLWWWSRRTTNSWRFKLADFEPTQQEFVLIAVYGPPLEEGPVEGQTPPPGEIEPPPGG